MQYRKEKLLQTFTWLKKLANHSALAKSLLLIIGMASILSACATYKETNTERALKPGLARISFQAPDRVPNLFKEKLFGRLSSLTTESGINLELTPENSDLSRLFIDVPPGTYKIKAECDPVKNYSGEQINWLANHTTTLQANQIIKLGCEYYTEDKILKTATESTLQGYKRKSDRKFRRVKVVQLNSRILQ